MSTPVMGTFWFFKIDFLDLTTVLLIVTPPRESCDVGKDLVEKHLDVLFHTVRTVFSLRKTRVRNNSSPRAIYPVTTACTFRRRERLPCWRAPCPRSPRPPPWCLRAPPHRRRRSPYARSSRAWRTRRSPSLDVLEKRRRGILVFVTAGAAQKKRKKKWKCVNKKEGKTHFFCNSWVFCRTITKSESVELKKKNIKSKIFRLFFNNSWVSCWCVLIWCRVVAFSVFTWWLQRTLCLFICCARNPLHRRLTTVDGLLLSIWRSTRWTFFNSTYTWRCVLPNRARAPICAAQVTHPSPIDHPARLTDLLTHLASSWERASRTRTFLCRTAMPPVGERRRNGQLVMKEGGDEVERREREREGEKEDNLHSQSFTVQPWTQTQNEPLTRYQSVNLTPTV